MLDALVFQHIFCYICSIKSAHVVEFVDVWMEKAGYVAWVSRPRGLEKKFHMALGLWNKHVWSNNCVWREICTLISSLIHKRLNVLLYVFLEGNMLQISNNIIA